MKKIKAVIMGFGDRGQVYAEYAEKRPDVFEIAGVVDPDPVRVEKAKKRYNLKEEYCFTDPAEFYARDKFCDAVINATMDSLHYATTAPLLEKGYNVLLEKPVSSNPSELRDLARRAKENGVTLMVCHVLRYAPFYREIKKVILSGEIGDIRHIYLAENVAVYHMLSSYIRGKWSSESECGSGMLMAKCCHDLDLAVWLKGNSRPKAVTSVGSRRFFNAANKPAGGGTRCLTDCRIERECPYSCRKLYLENDVYPFLVWTGVEGKDWSEVTDLKEREELLKTVNPHGKCCFEDKDLVDQQSVLILFGDGSTATLDMIGGVTRPGRNIHIVGETGEIEGFLEDNVFFTRKYLPETTGYSETKTIITEDVSGAHSGGDLRLVKDFVATVSGGERSPSCTDIEDSIDGHLVAVAAEISRKTGKTVFTDMLV
ncbi:MAG: Gfo/Idh/MocA family oxidoreductase [Clostridia bacterium]|nr:Gfo/Idh/MocA family oxidoreductase [Clostridia bacterium]